MNLTPFIDHIKSEAAKFKKLIGKRVILFHHNDTDGLSSGAILSSAFERLGAPLFRYCLEKPYPEALERILGDEDLPPGTVIVFADFGSGMLPQISKLNRRGHEVFILDHHAVSDVSDPKIHLVNCLKFDIPGSSHCTASAVCGLFALSLYEGNRDLAWLGVLGALGDHQFDRDGMLTGINQHLHTNYAAQTIKRGDSDYTVSLSDGEFNGERVVEWINALGSFGYLQGGTDIAIKGLKEGFDIRYRKTAEKFEEEFTGCFERWLSGMKLQRSGNIQWFILPESFSSFGVKSVGLICEKLLALEVADPECYLAGFQTIPNTIPGLGEIKLNQSKVSMRIPPKLLVTVKEGKAPGLPDILPAATFKVGGFSDGCHLHAGASTVPIGKEANLIEELDQEIALRRHKI